MLSSIHGGMSTSYSQLTSHKLRSGIAGIVVVTKSILQKFALETSKSLQFLGLPCVTKPCSIQFSADITLNEVVGQITTTAPFYTIYLTSDPVLGRYVGIRLNNKTDQLHIAEVKVYGYPGKLSSSTLYHY
jgi:hypothetical protein